MEELVSTTRKSIKKSTLMFMISMMAITIVFMVAVLIVTVSYFLSKEKEPTGVVLASGEAIYTEEELNLIISQKEEDAKEELLDYIKGSIQDGRSTVGLLRELYPEATVLSADGRYHIFDINENLPKNPYLNDNFKMDENFEKNIKGANENGIQVGVYFFTQAINEEEAVEEANYVLEAIKDYDVTYPVVIDIEKVTDKGARTKDMTKEDWTKVCIAFCETIKEAGYTPMVYGNLKTFFIMLDMEQISMYDKWFAQYDTSVYFPYDFKIWQYSDSGSVNGISSTVDMNVSFYEPAN